MSLDSADLPRAVSFEDATPDPVVRQLRLQYRVAGLLARAASAQDGLAKALDAIASSEGWDAGATWLLKGQGWAYQCGWQRPSAAAQGFPRDRQRLAPLDGPSPDEAGPRRPHWTDDLGARADTADLLAMGLTAALSLPLEANGSFYGMVELFRCTAEPHSDSDVALYQSLANDIGQFIHARRVESSLVHTHARFAEAQRLARLAHWEYTPANGRLRGSDGIADLLGLEAEQLPATEDGYLALVVDEDRAKVLQAVRDAMSPGAGPLQFEHRLRDAQGRERVVAVRTETQFDEDGSPKRISGTLQDVTEQRSATARILASERRWEAAFQNSPVPSIITDVATGRCLAANDAMLEFLGMPSDQVIGQCSVELEFWSTRDERRQMLGHLKQHGSLRQYEFTTRQGGQERFVLGNMELVELNGRGCLLSQLVDVTPRKQLEETLRLTAAAVEHAGEGLLLLAANGTIITANPAFTRITGYRQDQAAGMLLDELLHRPTKRHDERFFRRIAGSLTIQGHWEGQAWARRRDGSDFPAFLTLNAIRDDSNHITHYVAVFSDISKQREYEQRLEQLALHDSLTGLANRTLLMKHADLALLQAERHGRHLAVLFADLDRFKEVNDLYGHAAGDELLMQVAQRLSASVRSVDTVARLGGDEFVVLLPEVESPDHAYLVADKIMAALAAPYQVGGMPVEVGASLGVARYPEDGLDMPALLRHADGELYRRKPTSPR